ncbi:hypothetical protein JTE90_029164 [Oedothorax gibbosus]|uniref:Uncharacterized protein n=1 Tax=Oedothorax gibbosus TaxID=931172 RepID=A0AAV6VFN0_9ARAC|nr:hypothetical protein JTE90_029164 [Oedothorax gibbosus]
MGKARPTQVVLARSTPPHKGGPHPLNRPASEWRPFILFPVASLHTISHAPIPSGLKWTLHRDNIWRRKGATIGVATMTWRRLVEGWLICQAGRNAVLVLP